MVIFKITGKFANVPKFLKIPIYQFFEYIIGNFGCTRIFELPTQNFVRKFDLNFNKNTFEIMKLYEIPYTKRGGDKLNIHLFIILSNSEIR